MLSVRDAFQILQDRGIARDKQEIRKWLNEGYIQAEPERTAQRYDKSKMP